MSEVGGSSSIHASASDGFDREASVYAGVRPNYHPAVVARVAERFGSGPVAELGAGTGIFTGQLVAAGVEPVAIEPVEAMRKVIESTHDHLLVIDGTAEDTGLEPQSVATVVVAQAFHWFVDHAFELVDEWSTPNPVSATPESVVARALSTSFIAALDPEVQGDALRDIREIAESVGPSFDFPYRSELQAWRLV